MIYCDRDATIILLNYINYIYIYKTGNSIINHHAILHCSTVGLWGSSVYHHSPKAYYCQTIDDLSIIIIITNK